MFNNIFTDRLNRLVFQDKGPERANVQATAEITQESLRDEGKRLSQAIVDFSQGIMDDINEERTNLLLKPLKDFEDMKKNYAGTPRMKVMEQLGKAQLALHEADKKNGFNRVLLDNVRSQMNDANTRYQAYREISRREATSSLSAASLDVNAIGKAQPKKAPEVSRDTARWTRIGKLIEAYGKAPADQRNAIQLNLRNELDAVGTLTAGVAYPVTVIDANNKQRTLYVEKAKGPGTDAYKLTWANDRRNPVYAGGSAKDFA